MGDDGSRKVSNRLDHGTRPIYRGIGVGLRTLDLIMLGTYGRELCRAVAVMVDICSGLSFRPGGGDKRSLWIPYQLKMRRLKRGEFAVRA